MATTTEHNTLKSDHRAGNGWGMVDGKVVIRTAPLTGEVIGAAAKKLEECNSRHKEARHQLEHATEVEEMARNQLAEFQAEFSTLSAEFNEKFNR